MRLGSPRAHILRKAIFGQRHSYLNGRSALHGVPSVQVSPSWHFGKSGATIHVPIPEHVVPATHESFASVQSACAGSQQPPFFSTLPAGHLHWPPWQVCPPAPQEPEFLLLVLHFPEQSYVPGLQGFPFEQSWPLSELQGGVHLLALHSSVP